MKIYSILFGAILICSLEACTTTTAKSETENNVPQIPVVTLSFSDTTLINDFVADIQATQHVELRAHVRGFLNQIHVDEGQMVKKGQLLFSLNDDIYRAELAKTKANLANAFAEEKAALVEVNRQQLLVDKKVVSATELALAKAKYQAAGAKIKEAEAAIENARLHQSYTQIKAPYSGLINRIPLKKGSLIEEGTLLTTISDINQVFAYFHFSESDYLRYRKNHETPSGKVTLALSDGSVYPVAGDIEAMAGAFDEATGNIAVRARFNNQSLLLKHGASGKIRIAMDLSNVLIIPQKAVMEIQDKYFVFVVNADNKIKMRPIQVAHRINQTFVVKSGLQAGERIITEGIQQVKDGMTIKPITVTKNS